MGSSEVVQSFLDLALAGKVEAAAELVADDFVIAMPASLPWGGSYRGPKAYFDLVATIGQHAKSISVAWMRLTDLDDGRALLEIGLAIHHPSGATLDTTMIETWTLTDGLLARVDAYYTDTSAIVAFLAED